MFVSVNVISDIVHDNIDLTNATIWCDLLVLPCFVVTLIWLAIWPANKFRHPRIFSKFIFVMATLYLLRCFTIISTVMPNPDKHCTVDQKLFDNWFYGAFLILTCKSKTCSDEIFSGHTINVLTCAAAWIIYGKSKIIDIIAILYSFIALFIIIATRYHYTIDVVIGFIITLLVHLICYQREIRVMYHRKY